MLSLLKSNRVITYLMVIFIILTILPTLHWINVLVQQNVTKSTHKRLIPFKVITSIRNSINHEPTKHVTRQRGTRNRTYVLMWRHPWGVFTEGIFVSQHSDCMVTYDRDKLKDAAAVVFHYSALDEETMPWKHYRDPEQLFVFYSVESPPYMYYVEKRQNMHKFDGGFINWTMSYKSDADVFFPYMYPGSVEGMLVDGKNKIDEMMKLKSRVALWVVSNCDATFSSQMRMKYSNELVNTGLPLHRFGSCFSNKEEYENLSAEVRQSYKFYLAFENAHCKDYITEKFWNNAISSWRVPVVLGPSKDDVTKLAPPGSFIHADDFDSPAELTKYLLYLDSNDTAYREYFKWIEEATSEATVLFARKYESIRVERLCEMVKSRRRTKTINNVTDNMYKQERKECLFKP